MLKSKDVNKEIRILEDLIKPKENDTPEVSIRRAELKAITLAVKLLRDIRTNQTTIMKAQNVELQKVVREGTDEEQK